MNEPNKQNQQPDRPFTTEGTQKTREEFVAKGLEAIDRVYRRLAFFLYLPAALIWMWVFWIYRNGRITLFEFGFTFVLCLVFIRGVGLCLADSKQNVIRSIQAQLEQDPAAQSESE